MLPENASCLRCGYLLQGLVHSVCPECGQAFSPSDPASYRVRSARRAVRRWAVRGAFVLVVLGLLGWLCPSGWWIGTMAFTCSKCGATGSFERWQLESRSFAPCSYAAIGRDSWPTPAPAAGPACAHLFGVNAKVRFFELTWRGPVSVGGVSASGAYPDKVILINHIEAVPGMASTIIRSMIDQQGVSIEEKTPEFAALPPGT